ncbi:MAG: beta-glucosidase [Lachnospiraceae bacterium]|nr:beta-glucosidase [Lachnospiraceae bacterium]
MFREGFVWGVAASAFQVEGTDPDDGRGTSIWDTYAKDGKCSGMDGKTACDHMHRYEEDYKLMASLGVKAYRFSVSWARIIPDGIGKVNEKGIKLYRDMIIKMKENGIKPFLTLYHWDIPQVLQDKGGWLNPEVVDWFENYASVVTESFSDIVQDFITINEPQCFSGLGYISGEHAPGLKVTKEEGIRVTLNVLKAQGAAVKAIRKHAKQKVYIMYAPTSGVAIPATDSDDDIEAARQAYFGLEDITGRWFWNVSWFSDPVMLGKFPEEGLKKYKDYMPKITDADLELISQDIDYYGQNIYNGYTMRMGADGKPEYVERAPGSPITGNHWPVTPRALYYGPKFLYERYKKPIFITENGLSVNNWVSLDGKVHDPERIDFLHRYIKELKRATDDGVDVRGYFHWSFLDNFEWTYGYRDRFGLVYVDYDTQQRIPKDSAYWFKEVMDSNGGVI